MGRGGHLHAFRLVDLRRRGIVEVGVPDDDFRIGRNTLSGQEVLIEDLLDRGFPVAVYEYDFGDGWIHVVQLEGRFPACRGQKYPFCIAGERRCPPEDCGGIGGYEEFIQAISDPDHPEHAAMLDWVGGSCDPEEFDPSEVVFGDPDKRWDLSIE